MDAQEKLGTVTKKVQREGTAAHTEFVTTTREHLTIDKYFLGGNPPDVMDLFRFLMMYEENLRKEVTGKLMLSKFIRLEYLTILEHHIKELKGGRFRHHYIMMMNNGGHIWNEGEQAMPNSALTEVITYVASPRSRYQTYMALTRSVFPYKNWEKYTSIEYIQKNLRGYLHEWIAYGTRFESYVDLLKHVRKHLPKFYMKKLKEDGLLDFMFKCSPCAKFMYMALQECKEGEGDDKINDKDDWDTIQTKLRDKIEHWADLYDYTEDANQRMLGRGRLEFQYRPPYEIEIGVRRKEREKSRVHAVQDHSGYEDEEHHVTFQLPEWQDGDFDEEDPEDEDDEEGYNTASEYQHEPRLRVEPQSDVQRELRNDEDVILDQFSETCLKQMESSVHKGKNVCWSFATTGKCSFEAEGKTCRFSHEPEDVKRYNDARELGQKFASGAVKTPSRLSFGPARVGSATSPGPRGTSPGVRQPFRDGRTPAVRDRRASYPPKRY